MKIAIALDNWKLPIFRKGLTDAGYEYTDAGGLTHDSTVLTVVTDNILALKAVVEKCQAECRRSR